MENLLRFWYLRFYRFVFYKEVLPFHIWFYDSLLDCDVCLHDLVVLFAAIPTSPRSWKIEFGCSRYHRFRLGVSAAFRPAVVPDRYRPGTVRNCGETTRNPPGTVVPLPGGGSTAAGRVLHITVGFWRSYLKGSSFPTKPRFRARVSTPLLTLLSLPISLSLQWFLLLLEGKERGDLDLYFHQSISPLSEGSILDLDLWDSFVVSLLFLPSSSIVLVTLVGFESGELWALLVFLPLH